MALEPLSEQDGSAAPVAAGAEIVTCLWSDGEPDPSVAAGDFPPRWEVLVVVVWVKRSIPCTDLSMGWW